MFVAMLLKVCAAALIASCVNKLDFGCRVRTNTWTTQHHSSGGIRTSVHHTLGAPYLHLLHNSFSPQINFHELYISKVSNQQLLHIKSYHSINKTQLCTTCTSTIMVPRRAKPSLHRKDFSSHAALSIIVH